jgi:hypothetical protein
MKNKVIENPHNGLATKKDVNESEDRLNKRIDRVIKYIDLKINPFEEMRQDFYDFKNKIFDRLDWLIGRYKKFEDEYTVQAEQNKRILDRLENHEERISHMEITKHN